MASVAISPQMAATISPQTTGAAESQWQQDKVRYCFTSPHAPNSLGLGISCLAEKVCSGEMTINELPNISQDF